MKTRTIIIIAALFTLFPLIQVFQFEMGSEVMVDGITISSSYAITLSVGFSLMSWFLLSVASKNVPPLGIFLAINTGALLLLPFSQVLGPMAAIIVGVVAGVAAFLFQQKLTNPAQNKSLVAGIAIVLITYLVLFIMIFLAHANTDGIGAWTGTAEEMEPQRVYFGEFGNIGNYILLLIVLPSLVVSWIKAKQNESIAKYYSYFGVAFMGVGGLFFITFFQEFARLLFIAGQPNGGLPENIFFHIISGFFFQQISFHVLGIALIVFGFLVFKKRFAGEIKNG